jgi:hypothetical protein
VIRWKHGVVELDETVQKVDIHHTVRSSYISFLVHTVGGYERRVGREAARKERRSQHATASGS